MITNSLKVLLWGKEIGRLSWDGRRGISYFEYSREFLEGTLEGSIIRVSPAGVRALRNTDKSEMIMMCIQYEAKPITSFMEDANIIAGAVKW